MSESTFDKFLATGDVMHGSDADALVLACIDYRYTDVIPKYLKKKYPKRKFDYVGLAGASLSVFSGIRPQWATTFWEHLDVAIDLHQIEMVLILDHRDCGAYREFHALPATPPSNSPQYQSFMRQEKQVHIHYMERLAAFIRQLHPRMIVKHDLLDVPSKKGSKAS